MSVVVRSIERSDIPAALKLAAASLGRGSVPRTEEFWRWKHLGNPFGESPGLVAESKGEIVALRMFLRWRFQGLAGPVEAVRAVDTATASAFRGQGLFRRLTMELVESLTEQGVGFVFNTPNRVSRNGYLKMGWQDLGRVPVRIKIVRPVRFVLGFLRSQPTVLGDMPPWPADAAERLADAAAGAFEGESRWHTDRTVEYFAWRYATAPGLFYGYERSEDGSESAVWRRRVRGSWVEGAVVETLDASGRGTESPDVLRTVWNQSGVDYAIATAQRGTPESRRLRRAGFWPVPRQGPFLTSRPLAEASPSHWGSSRLSVGDLELF